MSLLTEIRATLKPAVDENRKKLKEAREAIEAFEKQGIDTSRLRIKLLNAERRQKQAESI